MELSVFICLPTITNARYATLLLVKKIIIIIIKKERKKERKNWTNITKSREERVFVPV